MGLLFLGLSVNTFNIKVSYRMEILPCCLYYDFFFSNKNNKQTEEKIIIKAVHDGLTNHPIKRVISKYDNSILCYMVSFCVAGFLSFGEALKNLRCGNWFSNVLKKGKGIRADRRGKNIYYCGKLYTQRQFDLLSKKRGLLPFNITYSFPLNAS